MLIVCGGTETERQYLQGLRDHLRNAAVRVVVRGKACSPTQLVTYARRQRDLDRDAYDEVWCVFDVDDYVDDYVDVAEAAVAARRHGIRIAVSNPCFELWLLLHFTDHRAHVATKKLLPLMEKHLPGYDKTRVEFGRYEGRVRAAGDRARRLAPTGEEPTRNPSTGVWRLTDRMANP